MSQPTWIESSHFPSRKATSCSFPRILPPIVSPHARQQHPDFQVARAEQYRAVAAAADRLHPLWRSSPRADSTWRRPFPRAKIGAAPHRDRAGRQGKSRAVDVDVPLAALRCCALVEAAPALLCSAPSRLGLSLLLA